MSVPDHHTLFPDPVASQRPQVMVDRCNRCVTDMPAAALAYRFCGQSVDVRCKNVTACDERERKNMARTDEILAFIRGGVPEVA